MSYRVINSLSPFFFHVPPFSSLLISYSCEICELNSLSIFKYFYKDHKHIYSLKYHYLSMIHTCHIYFGNILVILSFSVCFRTINPAVLFKNWNIASKCSIGVFSFFYCYFVLVLLLLLPLLLSFSSPTL